MKAAFLLLRIALAMIGLTAYAQPESPGPVTRQGRTFSSPSFYLSLLAPGWNPNSSAPTPPSLQPAITFVLTNSAATNRLFPGTLLPSFRTNLFSNAPIARAMPSVPPGVYEAEPYKAIVVVPGPHPDDRCIIGQGAAATAPAMPMIKPELRLVPRKQ
jgi:hypothetical protein